MCAERGVDAPDTIDKAAASILAVMDGLQLQWLLDPDGSISRRREFAIEALVAAVLSPQPSRSGRDRLVHTVIRSIV